MTTGVAFGGAQRSRSTSAPAAARQIVSDGVWTWYNRPQARFRNGATYLGFNTAAGVPKVAKWDHATKTAAEFSLAGALQVDDHMVPGMEFWPDGKLLAVYSKLGDTVVRRRTTTSSEDITAWDAEQTLTPVGGVVSTYTSPYYLTGPGRMFLFVRTHDASGRTHRYSHTTDGTSWSSFAAFYKGATGSRPYLVQAKKGTDEIHFCATDAHPDSGQTSIYHFYGKWDSGSGALKFYKSDGTEITASLPFAPADTTQVYSGATNRAWNWDIAIGSDGHPRVLFTSYPGNNGTDIRINFSRWTGSAWTTAVDIKGASVGQFLYSPEIFYTGGAAFDAADPNTVYLSSYWRTSGRYDIQRLVTTDNGATWNLRADLSAAASGEHCIRPVSPRDHDGAVPVLWVQGVYTTFTDYSTRIMGVA